MVDISLVPTDTNLPEKQPKYKNLNRGRWLKGESGNPNGRPRKDACLSSLYQEELARLHGETNLTKEQIIADKVVKHLTEQEIDATWLRLLELIQERTEGKVTQSIAGEIETILTVRYDR